MRSYLIIEQMFSIRNLNVKWIDVVLGFLLLSLRTVRVTRS